MADGASLEVVLERPTRRLVCIASSGAESFDLIARASWGAAKSKLRGRPGHEVVAELELPEPTRELRLETSVPADLWFVGSEPLPQ